MGPSKQHPAPPATAPAGGTPSTPALPPAELAATSRVAGAIVYSLSGILLTLVNKVAIRLFSCTCLLVIMQNAMTVLLLLAGSSCFRATLGSLPLITCAVVRRWAPLSGLFVAILVSSLLALKDVSAVTLVDIVKHIGAWIVCVE